VGAGHVAGDHVLGAEVFPLEAAHNRLMDKSERLRRRLRLSKDRPKADLVVPSYVDLIEDLDEVAKARDISGAVALARFYIGQGLRKDLQRIDTGGLRVRLFEGEDEHTIDEYVSYTINVREGMIRRLQEIAATRDMRVEDLLRAYAYAGVLADLERQRQGLPLLPLRDEDKLTKEKIMALAVQVLGSEEKAEEWMHQPQQLGFGSTHVPADLEPSTWNLSRIEAALKAMQPKVSLKDHLLATEPKVDDFNVERDRDTGRDWPEVFGALDESVPEDFMSEAERDRRPPEVRPEGPPAPQRIGLLAGQMSIGPEFFEPLSEDELRLWNGEGEDDVPSAPGPDLWTIAAPTKEDILTLATRVFCDPDKAGRWMAKGKHRFNERSPIEMLETLEGRLRVREMLGQIDEGMFA
jgi:uncharacterized protein (DUF2384 family)